MSDASRTLCEGSTLFRMPSRGQTPMVGRCIHAIRPPTGGAPVLGIVCFVSPWTVGCANPSPLSMLAPSPTITPDAVTIDVGDAEVFSVNNAPVMRFEVAAQGQNWSECVASTQCSWMANSIRLVALSRCVGFVYVMAKVAGNRSVVVAVVTLQ